MKKIYLIIASSLCPVIYSQTEVNVDALSAPSSVAFNLLGISPSSIDKPTDLTTFAASIQNASNNFTSIPSNYAMEILPFTLFGKTTMTTNELNSEKINDVFKQTFTFSFGISNELKEDTQTPELTRLGLGIKFSIFRPKFDDVTTAKINTIQADQAAILNKTAGSYNSDSVLDTYTNMKIDVSNSTLSDSEKLIKLKEINALELLRKQQIDKEADVEAKANLNDKINKETKDLKFNRKGFFLDFAVGSVLDFQEQTFNRSSISKGGAWLTGSYDTGKDWNFLGIARYLYQPDKILADETGLIDTKNISTLDGGFRLIYKEMEKQKLSISTEGLYRSVLNKDTIDPSWRVVLNASYDLGDNQILTLTFGKDFDNTLIKENNLITSLNYIIGLGAKRVIQHLN
ncbi:hypothetical protein [Flavobacterium sp.]|uniref:hypothetical protein n=1 Tax=Flavobacterium sp. TaxID=239 RepID=UPI002FDA5E66